MLLKIIFLEYETDFTRQSGMEIHGLFPDIVDEESAEPTAPSCRYLQYVGTSNMPYMHFLRFIARVPYRGVVTENVDASIAQLWEARYRCDRFQTDVVLPCRWCNRVVRVPIWRRGRSARSSLGFWYGGWHRIQLLSVVDTISLAVSTTKLIHRTHSTDGTMIENKMNPSRVCFHNLYSGTVVIMIGKKEEVEMRTGLPPKETSADRSYDIAHRLPFGPLPRPLDFTQSNDNTTNSLTQPLPLRPQNHARQDQLT